MTKPAEPPACPKMAGCPVFPAFQSNGGALKVLQTLYCEGDFSRCERYKSVQLGVIPPRKLLPHGGWLD